MKIALQITTSTLGDMVIEEADDKTTTNPDDQRAIVVELLIQALGKVTAAYKIPRDMLDLGDEEYEGAHARKVTQDKEPRYSSAEANRRAQELTQLSTQDDERCCSTDAVCSCRVVEEENPKEDTEEDLIISEEELEVVQQIIMLMRGKNV